MAEMLAYELEKVYVLFSNIPAIRFLVDWVTEDLIRLVRPYIKHRYFWNSDPDSICNLLGGKREKKKDILKELLSSFKSKSL